MSKTPYPVGEFPLGVKLRCKVTGFEGIATAVTTWANGCVRYGLQGKAFTKDGEQKVPDNTYFDQEQLELVPDAPRVPASTRTHGGDRGREVPRAY